jgi:serine/threonine protein kinase
MKNAPLVSLEELQVFSVVGKGSFSAVYKCKFSGNRPQEGKHVLQSGNDRWSSPEDSHLDATADEADDTSRNRSLHRRLKTSLKKIDCEKEDTPEQLDDSSLTTAEGSSQSSTVADIDASNESTLIPSESYYALKRLKSKSEMSCEKTREGAARDLAVELKIFNKLSSHPNIVTLCAASSSFWERPKDRFIVLEYLHMTLEEKLQRWKMREEARPLHQRMFQSQQSRRNHQLLLVQKIGLPIARAMSFLHSNQICYRDLKPSNVGFDYQDNVKLFDFGVARDLDERTDGVIRKMTPCTGSYRYMAPEVMTGQNYSSSVDVYAFSLLLCEILTLARPFSGCSNLSSLIDMVVMNRKRPSLQAVQDKNIQKLLKFGWHSNPDMRPSFALIVDELERICR